MILQHKIDGFELKKHLTTLITFAHLQEELETGRWLDDQSNDCRPRYDSNNKFLTVCLIPEIVHIPLKPSFTVTLVNELNLH